MIYTLLQKISKNFFNQRDTTPFSGNSFVKETISEAKKIKLEDDIITKIGFGQGRWAELPWIAFLNKNITTSPQQGYYIAYLFSGDGKKIYLTIALGVTNSKGLKQLKKDKTILINHFDKKSLTQNIKLCHNKINLKAQSLTPLKYEHSVICYKEYNVSQLPLNKQLENDLQTFLRIYKGIRQNITNINETLKSINNDTPKEINKTIFLSAKEYKKKVNHLRYEGRLSNQDINKIKKALGYTCQACGFNFAEKYPEIGKNYIEAHHKIPYSQLKKDEERTLTISDFTVLCANCHTMIHKLDDPSDIDKLKAIININKKK